METNNGKVLGINGVSSERFLKMKQLLMKESDVVCEEETEFPLTSGSIKGSRKVFFVKFNYEILYNYNVIEEKLFLDVVKGPKDRIVKEIATAYRKLVSEGVI